MVAPSFQGGDVGTSSCMLIGPMLRQLAALSMWRDAMKEQGNRSDLGNFNNNVMEVHATQGNTRSYTVSWRGSGSCCRARRRRVGCETNVACIHRMNRTVPFIRIGPTHQAERNVNEG
jgi:hypothetical protein